MAELTSLAELNERDHVVVDVRADREIEADPIVGANGEIVHMELTSRAHTFMKSYRRISLSC
jgi:hypothetical protein